MGELRSVMIRSWVRLLRPIVDLMLRAGVGYPEAKEVLKSVYVDVASSNYGVRNRPTNASRVAAMTGISRREVGRIRSHGVPSRIPETESTSTNMILHHWQFDSDFCVEPGVPRALQLQGDRGFSELVRRYGRDVPAGAIRAELLRAGTIEQRGDSIRIVKQYHEPQELDETLVLGIGFRGAAMISTAAYNARRALAASKSQGSVVQESRLERFAWSTKLSARAARDFEELMQYRGAQLIQFADQWIGNNEELESRTNTQDTPMVGIGVYFFRDS